VSIDFLLSIFVVNNIILNCFTHLLDILYILLILAQQLIIVSKVFILGWFFLLDGFDINEVKVSLSLDLLLKFILRTLASFGVLFFYFFDLGYLGLLICEYVLIVRIHSKHFSVQIIILERNTFLKGLVN
jgi:hypothetical protein